MRTFDGMSWVLILAIGLVVAFLAGVGVLFFDASQVTGIVWDRLQGVFEPLIGFAGVAFGWVTSHFIHRSMEAAQARMLEQQREIAETREHMINELKAELAGLRSRSGDPSK